MLGCRTAEPVLHPFSKWTNQTLPCIFFIFIVNVVISILRLKFVESKTWNLPRLRTSQELLYFVPDYTLSALINRYGGPFIFLNAV